MKKFGGVATIGILVILLLCLMCVFSSNYALSPAGVQTNISDSSFSNFFSRMTKLGPELKCNPGSADIVDPRTGQRAVQSSYYTGGLLPGGYCDDQEVVKAAIDYKLMGGDAVLGD